MVTQRLTPLIVLHATTKLILCVCVVNQQTDEFEQITRNLQDKPERNSDCGTDPHVMMMTALSGGQLEERPSPSQSVHITAVAPGNITEKGLKIVAKDLISSALRVENAVRRYKAYLENITDGVAHQLDHEVGQYLLVVMLVAKDALTQTLPWPPAPKPDETKVRGRFAHLFPYAMMLYANSSSSKVRLVRDVFQDWHTKLCPLYDSIRLLAAEAGDDDRLLAVVRPTEDAERMIMAHIQAFRIVRLAEDGLEASLRRDLRAMGAARYVLLHEAQTLELTQKIIRFMWEISHLAHSACKR